MPADILQSLQQIWRSHRLKASTPEDGAELIGSSDSWLLDLGDEILDRVHKQLRPVVERWAGLESGQLVPTDSYGARLYRKGSHLKMHVDSGIRAALSVILEIGHLGF